MKFILTKPTLLILILFCLSHSLMSQSKTVPSTKKPLPTGFGKFKIGKTTIQELNNLDSSYTWFMKINNKIDSLTGAEIEYSLFGDEFTYGLIYSGIFYGQEVKMGLVKDYIIADDKANLILLFFKDTLVQITTTEFTSTIRELWNLKYGEGNLKTRTKIITCNSKYGDYTETETYNTFSWESPISKVQAIWEFDTYFDSKCKKQYTNYFQIKNPKRVKLLETSSEKYVSKILQKIEDQKKKQAIDSDL